MFLNKIHLQEFVIITINQNNPRDTPTTLDKGTVDSGQLLGRLSTGQLERSTLSVRDTPSSPVLLVLLSLWPISDGAADP